MPLEDDRGSSRMGEIPYPHGPVCATRSQPSVRSEGDGDDRAPMPLKDNGIGVGMGEVPHPHGLVLATRGQVLPVGSEGDGDGPRPGAPPR